jgi:2-amino-4-hydroxy-6-hydroxymethyldihydropteridine diphosphokinase
MRTAYIGVGANLGDTAATIDAAVVALDGVPGVTVTGLSALRETDPVGYLDQPPFLNGAIRVETTLEPGQLLAALLAVEAALGRTREGPRFGPRVIDLDLLLHGDRMLVGPGLEVPHPRLHERAFALEPLLDLEPGLEVPGRGRVDALLAALGDTRGRPVRAPRLHPEPRD